MWTVLDWLLTIMLVVGGVVWVIWFSMRVIKSYALADGSGWRRLGAAVIAVLSASWATVIAPFRALWLACFKSLTMLWAYLGIAGSYFATNLDELGPLLGDPDLKRQIVDALQSNPKLLGYALGLIFVVTFLTRLRSIVLRQKE